MYRHPNTGNDIAPEWYNPGYTLLYHDDGVNHCPGCGKQQWLVGRVMAECAFCETALPIEHSRRPYFAGGLQLQ
ncbi:hypothetical protein [Sphingomonas sp.]|uniref:hypothetical protein n=1 Tax=Sphingomonas sp. TaxID=28214 RepID=UPI002CE3731E|nr:hypothetical protein [Sphingomonas sp.]HWK37209.1 hypothetical protein [Sphingomonas sp.]